MSTTGTSQFFPSTSGTVFKQEQKNIVLFSCVFEMKRCKAIGKKKISPMLACKFVKHMAWRQSVPHSERDLRTHHAPFDVNCHHPRWLCSPRRSGHPAIRLKTPFNCFYRENLQTQHQPLKCTGNTATSFKIYLGTFLNFCPHRRS